LDEVIERVVKPRVLETGSATLPLGIFHAYTFFLLFLDRAAYASLLYRKVENVSKYADIPRYKNSYTEIGALDHDYHQNNFAILDVDFGYPDSLKMVIEEYRWILQTPCRCRKLAEEMRESISILKSRAKRTGRFMEGDYPREIWWRYRRLPWMGGFPGFVAPYKIERWQDRECLKILENQISETEIELERITPQMQPLMPTDEGYVENEPSIFSHGITVNGPPLRHRRKFEGFITTIKTMAQMKVWELGLVLSSYLLSLVIVLVYALFAAEI
jgi:hypothetical protein